MALEDRIDRLQANLERRFGQLGREGGQAAPPWAGEGVGGPGGRAALPWAGAGVGGPGGRAAPPWGGEGVGGLGGRPVAPWGGEGVGGFAGGGAPPWGGENVGGALGGRSFPALAAYKDRQAAKVAAKNAPPGTAHTGLGLEPAVAQWAKHTQDTFGGIMDPDIMLAIMINESHGNPKAYNPAGQAWGLFQQQYLNSYDPEQQFQGAYKLAQQKLAGINQAYKANGLNPDARTRARDFALAWAGHFDYNTGTLNPNSRDVGPGQQTAEEYAAIFLGNYDTVKAGRKAQPGGGGTPGSMNAIWGGGDAGINQEYGVVDPKVDQRIYTYGADYGLPQGHTGLDIHLTRGTKLYAPMAGVITIAGTGGYFTDEDYGDDGKSGKRGEIMLTLANGDQIILGHTSQINVRQGDKIAAGQLLGLSGSASGDHLHLEVRQMQRDGSYRLVNPHDYFAQQQPAGGPAGNRQ